MTQVGNHLRKCWNEQDPSVSARRRILNLCLASMKKDALLLSRLPFSTQGRTYLKDEFLVDVHSAAYCGDCFIWATRISKLRKQHQKGRRPNCSRDKFVEGCSCYRPMYSDVLIPPDFNRESLCHRFRFYLEYIQRTAVSSIEHIPNDPLTSGIQELAGNPHAPTALSPVRMDPPSPTRPFATWSSSTALFDSFAHGVDFIPGHTNHNAEIFLHELQSVTTPCKMQADVMDFAMNVYGSMALQYFSGSYSALAEYLSSKCRNPFDQWEQNIMDASAHFIDRSHEQLISVDSSLLIDATKTGKYDTKASMYRVNNTLRHYFEDIEHRVEDDGDTIYLPTNEDKDVLFERVRCLVDASDSHGGGMPKKLGRKSKGTESQYKCDFARFILFFARSYRHFFDAPTNKAIGDRLNLFVSDVYNTSGGRDRALGVIATFTLLSLDLPTEANYNSMVMKSHTLPAVYAMAKAVHVSRRENDSYVYRIESPATTHGATSSLLHTLRVGSVGCMVHAALTRDESLQRRLPSIHTLCCSGAILELSMLARVCKNYEQFLSRGIEPAQHRVEDGEDVFRIRQSSEKGSYIDFKRRHFHSALQNGCRDLEESMRELLITALSGKEIEIETDDGERKTIILNNENMRILLCALFHTSARFYEPGTHDQCLETVQVPKRSRTGGAKSISIDASTVSARFWIRFPGGIISHVDSCNLSHLVAQALLDDLDFRSKYDQKDVHIRTIFGSLMQFSMRGTARPWEMLTWKPGITNDSTISEFRADVVVRSVNLPFADRLACSFRRNKHGGSGVDDTGFMEMPHLAGHLLGVFLSIFHSAGADFLFKVNGCLPTCSSLARLFLSRFFCTTEFSSESHTYGKWPGNERTFTRCLERLFGLPNESISLATFRQVMCSVSTLQQSQMDFIESKSEKKLVSESRARGFNHNSNTRDRSYNHAHQEGNQFIAFQRQGLSEKMDEFHHNWIGDQALLTPITSSAPALEAWRCPRLPTDEEALGFLLLCSSIKYEIRAPYQRLVLTEALSMSRDSLVIAPCGSGKTNAIVASVLYSKLCVILRNKDDPDLQDWLQCNIAGCNRRDEASRIVSDVSVQKFLRFCRNDHRPLAPNKFTVCIVPHSSAVDELISHINSMQLAKAVLFNNEDLQASVESALDAGNFPSNSFSFDVLVMTAAQAVQDKPRVFLEKCLEKQLLYTLVVDESHCFVTDISYMRCLGIIANLPRHGAPLLALTGSLPRCLVKSLASVLQASFGICLSTWRQRCTIDNSHHGIDENHDKSLRQYTDNNGVWRPSNTIPPNVAHCALPIPAQSDTSTAHLVKKVIEKLDNLELSHCVAARKILIICGTTNLVCEINRILGHTSIMLLGKRNKGRGLRDEAVDSDQYQAFREGWVEGGVRIGVGTTVLAQCINQAECDLVICVDLLFNLLTYLQASSRGGRSKQRSLALFLYREKALQVCCNRQIDLTPYRFWGVDVECPLVQRSLSTDSLLPFLQHGSANIRCRRDGITLEMDSVIPGDADNSIPVNVTVSTDWCCDICSSDIGVLRCDLLGVVEHRTPTRVAVSITQSQSQDWDDSAPVVMCIQEAPEFTPLRTTLKPSLESSPSIRQGPFPGSLPCDVHVAPSGDIPIYALPVLITPSTVATPSRERVNQSNLTISRPAPTNPYLHPNRPIGGIQLQNQFHVSPTDDILMSAAPVLITPSPVAILPSACVNQSNVTISRHVLTNPYLHPNCSIVDTHGQKQSNLTMTRPPPTNPYSRPNHQSNHVQDQSRKEHCRLSTSSLNKENIQASPPRPPRPAGTRHHSLGRTISYPDDGTAFILNGPVATLPLMHSMATKHRSSCPLKAFVTIADCRLLSCCAWHGHGVPPHFQQRVDKNPLGDKACRQSFVSFLGRRGRVCYKCGDDPSHCRRDDADIKSCQMQGLSFHANYCAHCAVHNDVGEPHNQERCPANRLWGLVIWAFRCERGHQLMSHQWNELSSARITCGDLPYPPIASFGRHSSERAQVWRDCLRFLVLNEMINRHFWRCMISVMEDHGHIATLRK